MIYEASHPKDLQCSAKDDTATDPFDVIDSHIHIFSSVERCHQLNWLQRGHVLDKPHDYNDYDQAGTPAGHAIFIECDTTTRGDNYDAVLDEICDASQDSRIVAIIAWAPMHSIRVLQRHLQRIKSVDERNLVRGIRVLIQDKPDGFCIQQSFIDCVAFLGTQDLLFEIGVDFRARGSIQLKEALQLIESCPDTTFVLNHLGKPALETPLTTDYQTFMAKMASHSRVFMKLSGCLTELPAGATLPHVVLAEHIKLNLELFGPKRLLFGSDWPVMTLSEADDSCNKTPQGWFNYCRRTLHELGVQESDARMIFGLNARCVYKLE